MTNRNSIFYNFPTQFPFGRNHCGLNGAIFALSAIIIGISGGIALSYFLPVHEYPASTLPATEAKQMQFTLSYINLPYQTIDLDKSFKTTEELQAFVLANYKQYTSYQVIVTASKRKA